MSFTTPQHFTSMDSALESLFGEGTKISRSERVSGGDINDAFRLTLTNGAPIFMKSNAVSKAAFFTAEAIGLQAIAKTGCIGTPRILCSGTETGGNGYSFLLLEWIEGKRPVSDYWGIFARQLADMHRHPPRISSQTETTDLYRTTISAHENRKMPRGKAGSTSFANAD